MFDKLYSYLFKRKINASFNDEIKMQIINNKQLRETYNNYSNDINSIISKFGNTNIIINNILIALNNNAISELNSLLNNPLTTAIIQQNILSIDELFFLSNHNNKLSSSDINNYKILSTFDNESLNNYFSFSMPNVTKENLPPQIFKKENYNNLILNSDINLFDYINNLTLKYSNSKIIIDKIASLLENGGINNFCKYISINKNIDFKCDFKIFEDKYFNKIGINNLIGLDLSNKKEIESIMTTIELNKLNLLDDYLLCKKNKIMVNCLNENNNQIFDLITDISYKKLFLFSKLFGVNNISPIMNQIINGYISLNQLDSELIAKYEPLINFITRINKCIDDKDFQRINNIINQKSLDYSSYFYKMEEDLNRNNAQLIVNSISNIKMYENQLLGKHIEDGINIIDFNGQPFSMLIHAVYQRSEKTREEAIGKRFENFDGCISTSLISDQYIHFYQTNQLVFLGYNSLNSNQIASAKSRDSGTTNKYQKENTTISLPKQIYDENSSSYNEVVVNTQDGRQMPNYILCFNNIDELSKKTAIKYNLPIYLVHTRCYPNSSIDGGLISYKQYGELQYDNLEQTYSSRSRGFVNYIILLVILSSSVLIGISIAYLLVFI